MLLHQSRLQAKPHHCQVILGIPPNTGIMIAMRLCMVLMFLVCRGWAADVCFEAPKCRCLRQLIICRRTTVLPGPVSLGSWPLNDHPPLNADLQECTLSATKLLAFVTRFSTLKRIDIRAARVPIPCQFIPVLSGVRDGLEVVSDCDTMPTEDTYPLTTSTDPSSSSAEVQSTSSDYTPSTARDNSSNPAHRLSETQELSGPLIAGWTLTWILLVVILVLLGCRFHRYALHGPARLANVQDDSSPADAEAGAVIPVPLRSSKRFIPLPRKSFKRFMGLGIPLLLPARGKLFGMKSAMKTPTAPELFSVISPEKTKNPSMIRSLTADTAMARPVVEDGDSVDAVKTQATKIYPPIAAGGHVEATSRNELSVIPSKDNPYPLPTPLSDHSPPSHRRADVEKTDADRPQPPPPYSEICGTSRLAVKPTPVTSDDPEPQAVSPQEPEPSPSPEPQSVSPQEPEPSPSPSPSPQPVTPVPPLTPFRLNSSLMTPQGITSTVKKAPLPRMLLGILNDQQRQVASEESRSRRRRRHHSLEG